MKGEYIVKRICQRLGLDLKEVLELNRTKKLSYVRFIMFKELRDEGLTFYEIGRVTNRDHTTVINGLKQFRNLIKYADFKNMVNQSKKENFVRMSDPRYCYPMCYKPSLFFAPFTINY